MGPGSDASLKGFFPNHRYKKPSLPLPRTYLIDCSTRELEYFFLYLKRIKLEGWEGMRRRGGELIAWDAFSK
jgi:hypothetical protein